ncbi:MAG: hypothetical protein ABIY70_18270 [Capsulimonas sp.]|uniref:hypothetical protein n=1 Tax=Capsulimonas sp. TaxID=2494211 RepID=UPI003265BA3E
MTEVSVAQLAWWRFARDGWSAKDAAAKMGVSEEDAQREIARIRPRVAAHAITEAVAHYKRSTWGSRLN